MQTNWIGNCPVPGGGGEIVILNPATEELIDSIPRGSPADADAAVAAIVCTSSAPGASSAPFSASGLGHGDGMAFLHELTLQKSVHWRDEPK